MNNIDFINIDLYKEPLTYDFIEKYKDDVDWYYITIFQILSEDFIEKYRDKVTWTEISIYQKLSERFIEKYRDKVDWYYISMSQKLSEGFIERYKDRVNWDYISKNQKLSKGFIERYKDRVNWDYILLYQILDKDFIENYRLNLYKDYLLSKDKEIKRQTLLDIGFYEIEGDYVYAYKAIRKDGYSLFNFIYQYKIGDIYESFFGLSVWSYEGAKQYYNKGKILKIRIDLDDILYFIKVENKLICTKIEIVGEVIL